MKLHILGSFKLFPGSKIDIWPFLKWNLAKKNFVKLIYLISHVFLAWAFLNFLAYCVSILFLQKCMMFFLMRYSFLLGFQYWSWGQIGNIGHKNQRCSSRCSSGKIISRSLCWKCYIAFECLEGWWLPNFVLCRRIQTKVFFFHIAKNNLGVDEDG